MTTIDDFSQQKPLVRFSIYTLIQADSLQRVGQKLCSLSQGWPEDIKGGDLSEYYDLFWLWVLGSYEVLRTMDQHSSCFSVEKQTEIKDLKKKLHKIRIPFAKQELRGRGGPIDNENSIANVSSGLRFVIEGQRFESCDLIHEVTSFLRSFAPMDIRSSIPTR
ncbi:MULTISPECIES: ubiquitin-like domain-containing protein [Ruegeria]|uniref:ubiquitin-like domain-containing protein n=1 Tax=Ruegeria TaxID=97050 RepID=UPI00147FD401|nr:MULTISPECIES: ubiquitin-like domain-containing protein [Ruegeria]